MEWPQEQIEELKLISPIIEQASEGGVTYFLMKNVQMPSNCSPSKTDLLLCPTPRDGYTSRLFFSEKVINPNKQLNWAADQPRILERNWQVYSWKINNNNLRLAQMFADHLRALI